jgi:hypothetical protein
MSCALEVGLGRRGAGAGGTALQGPGCCTRSLQLLVVTRRLGAVMLRAGCSPATFAEQSGSCHRKYMRPRHTPGPGPPGAGARCTTCA